MKSRIELVVSTGNAGKQREIKEILRPALTDKLILTFVPGVDVDENGDDFADNSLIKARANCVINKATEPGKSQLFAGEDSGLCVDALDGYPGVFTKRLWSLQFSGRKCLGFGPATEEPEDLDNFNNNRLLQLLDGIPELERTACYVSSLAIVNSRGELVLSVRGQAWGRIALKPSGCGGFGYDPIFCGADSNYRSWGDIPQEEKNLISHRRRALEQLQAVLPCLSRSFGR